MLEAFVWNMNPEIFSLTLLGHTFAPRWYGVCFASGLLFGYMIMKKYFKEAAYSEEDLNSLFVLVAIGTVVGARLGHCLFYEPAYYLSHPLKILFVWEGGLASHGGVMGVAVAIIYFCRKYKIPFMFIADHMAVASPLASGFIRLGNFFNSEIVGQPTNANWGVVFERVDNVPRHPAQLYESIIYFALFICLFLAMQFRGKKFKEGQPIGIMFIVIFAARFFVEFIKEEQVDFEKGMALNMGQLLSIPMVAVGFFFYFGGVAWLRKKFSSSPASGARHNPEDAEQARRARRKMQKLANKKSGGN